MLDVELNQISKTYNVSDGPAVQEISFGVQKGELFGLIGPDGAGKSTLFRILTTLLLPDSGQAFVNGYNIRTDVRAIRQQVGYMPGKFSLYQDLTIEENLHFFATIFETTIEANFDLIKDIYEQIEPFKRRRAGKLSGGMKQKLALCCALIHRPNVLFLDEPTTGVDTVSRKEFWVMLRRLKEQGITILVSTPYMDEATLCEKIALLQHGRILSIDTPAGIVKDYQKQLYAIKTSHMIKLLKDLRGWSLVERCYSFGEFHHVSFNVRASEATLKFIEAYLRELGHQNIQIEQIEPTIEDCFIQLMQ